MKPILVAMTLLAMVLSGASALAADPASGQIASVDSSSQARESTWTGTVEKRDVNGKSTYVLVAGGQTYILAPQEKAADFAGKTVTVTGTMKGKTVSIADIKEA